MIGIKQNDLGAGLRILNIKCPLRYNESTKETERKQALGKKKKKELCHGSWGQHTAFQDGSHDSWS